MQISALVKTRIIDGIRKDLERARNLHGMLIFHGMKQNSTGGNPTPFMQPDKRDITAFIFLEAAAKFENFCTEAFMLEVRHRLNVSPKRATFIMGSADKGLTGIFGWGAPKVLRERANHLFGKNGFFARLDTILGQTTYLRLSHAHVVRNRIAHSGGKASEDFNKILGQLNVPPGVRQGLSVGRLLLEYPNTVPDTDKWFYRFLNSYENLVESFDSYIVIP